MECLKSISVFFSSRCGQACSGIALGHEKWLVTRNGEPGMSYVSQEAAYEVAVAEAAGDLRTGHELRIEVLGSAYKRLGDGSPTATDEGRTQV